MSAGEQQNSRKLELKKEINPDNDFTSPSSEQWKAAAGKSLKGASFKSLVTPTYEEIDLQPIYTREDAAALPHLGQKPGFAYYLRGSTPGGYVEQPWEICQEIPAGLPRQFNEELKQDLQRGQTGIHLALDQAARKGLDSDAAAPGDAGRDGIAISTLEDLAAALAGIDIEKYPLHIEAGFAGLEVIMMLSALLRQQEKDTRRLKGSIDTDPLGFLITAGDLPVSLSTVYAEMAQSVNWAGQHAPHLKTIGISGLPYHNAGADAVRELAYTLATAVEYIDGLSEHGAAVEAICSNMRFTFGIGPFYFMEIARLRAARMLWAKIVEAYGGGSSAQKMTIHARTSSYNQTRYDPYVNMLRTTTEAFAAVAAGVDSLHTNRFNEVSGSSDEFSRRAARNIQVLLREECHLGQPLDPGGGSYYIEALTHEVSQKAWQYFQEIEAGGGMLKVLQKGLPQEETAALHEKRKQDLAQGKFLMVGTNFSANANEKKPELPPVDDEKIYRLRAQYLHEYRGKGKAEQQTAAVEKITALKKLLSATAAELVEAGAGAFSAGVTLGKISALIRPDKPGTGAVTIKSLARQRAAESFEEQRDAGEVS
jgi:methylmalonyl-CoA mutase